MKFYSASRHNSTRERWNTHQTSKENVGGGVHNKLGIRRNATEKSQIVKENQIKTAQKLKHKLRHIGHLLKLTSRRRHRIRRRRARVRDRSLTDLNC